MTFILNDILVILGMVIIAVLGSCVKCMRTMGKFNPAYFFSEMCAAAFSSLMVYSSYQSNHALFGLNIDLPAAFIVAGISGLLGTLVADFAWAWVAKTLGIDNPANRREGRNGER